METARLAIHARGEELGLLGLTKILKSVPPESAQGLINGTVGAVEVFRHSLAQMHDLTLLALSAH